MKKIMFNNRYGLEDAVLKRLKDLTRRLFPPQYETEDFVRFEWSTDGSMVTAYRPDGTYVDIKPTFKVGEVVAIAQSYRDIAHRSQDMRDLLFDDMWHCRREFEAGYNNKMFVRADLMPHQIRITDIRIERLQDISDEDCLREGIQEVIPFSYGTFSGMKVRDMRSTPREAFAALIDKVSGKGTWQRNSWVFVYEFELVK